MRHADGAISDAAPCGSTGRYVSGRERSAADDLAGILRDPDLLAAVLAEVHGGRARARAFVHAQLLDSLGGR